VITLLLLSRLRFPQQPAGEVQAPTQPLERLAASATYDELAAILRGVDRQVAGAILSVRAVPDSLSAADSQNPPVYVPAVRVTDDRAIAFPGPGRRIDTSSIPSGSAIDVLASDDPRGFALLRMPPAGRSAVPRLAVLDELPPSPGYLAGIEATRSGPAVRPLYFGRLDKTQDPRWSAPVLRFSALQQLLPAGAAVFTLDARFVGVGFPDGRDFIVIPAATLLAEAQRLAAGGSRSSAELDVEVQRLDADLRAATKASAGVIVTYVSPTGPAAGAILPADVITSVGGHQVQSESDYAAALTQIAANTPVPIELIRKGTPQTITVTPSSRGAAAEAAPPKGLGLQLRAVPGAGAEVVRVTPRSAAARAGIRPGDLITAFGDAVAPQPRVIDRAFQRAAAGDRLLVRLERGAAHTVVAVVKP
jgi:hypothetical protein